MKNFRFLPACWALLVLLASAISLWAGPSSLPSLTLDPSSSVSGAPGSTVGWGFTLTDNSSDYIEITASQFCADTFAYPFCDVPVTGTYNDFIGPNDVIVGPADVELTTPTASQPFGSVASTGVGSFAINPGATPGASDSGEIQVLYNLWSVDPNDVVNFDPNADNLGSDLVLYATASVTVTAGAAPSVPEPGTGGLLAFALAAAGLKCALNVRRRPQ